MLSLMITIMDQKKIVERLISAVVIITSSSPTVEPEQFKLNTGTMKNKRFPALYSYRGKL